MGVQNDKHTHTHTCRRDAAAVELTPRKEPAALERVDPDAARGAVLLVATGAVLEEAAA